MKIPEIRWNMNPQDYVMIIDNLKQIIEALGCKNRYYFYEHHNREPTTDEELVQFYIEQGGATNYRRKKCPKEADITGK